MAAETQLSPALYTPEQILRRPEVTGAFAVDPVGTREVDDAILVHGIERTLSGKSRATASVLIADGALLAPHEPIIEQAREMGFSRYSDTHPSRLMLPDAVLGQLGLDSTFSEHGVPAIEIRLRIERSDVCCEDIQRVRLTGAHCMTYDNFSAKANEGDEQAQLLMQAARLMPLGERPKFGNHDAPAIGNNLCGYNLPFRTIGSESAKKVVARFMLGANYGVARLIEESHVDNWVFRRFICGPGMMSHQTCAEYCPAPEPHTALKVRPYCHFTSPLRRFPDLYDHLILGSILDGREDCKAFGNPDTVSEQVNSLLHQLPVAA